jgi:hypothetical protein
MAKETRKVIVLASEDGQLSIDLKNDGWILKSEERITREEAEEMLGRDKAILRDVPGEALPKDKPLALCLYERDKIPNEPQNKTPKTSAQNLSLAERKRQKREPIIWLILSSLLFSGSFAFVIYAFPRDDKDFTFYLAIVNSTLILLGIGYSIVQIIKTRKEL